MIITALEIFAYKLQDTCYTFKDVLFLAEIWPQVDFRLSEDALLEREV